jgi:hypothetical protein
LKTLEGRKLYAQRKHIPEPVFGIIKSVLGFRQFLLRGLDHVRGEWNLVTMAWNLKRGPWRSVGDRGGLGRDRWIGSRFDSGSLWDEHAY